MWAPGLGIPKHDAGGRTPERFEGGVKEEEVPTYDYQCEDCKRTIEIFHPMSETRRKCPKCGSSRFKKLIGAGAGFLFRGSGFYITDYRSSEYMSKAKAESEGAGKAAAEKGGER